MDRIEAGIVIGSQSILGPFPDALRVLRQSMEADLYLNPSGPIAQSGLEVP